MTEESIHNSSTSGVKDCGSYTWPSMIIDEIKADSPNSSDWPIWLKDEN